MTNKNLSVTIIQSNLYWEDIEANLEMFAKKINNIKSKTDLIILPEMFTTGFSMKNKSLAEKMNGKSVSWMKELALKKKCVLTGSLIIEEKNKYYNRLVWMQPNGRFFTYDKRHLFSYGNEQNHYTAGKQKLIVELNGWKICPLVCYDLRFPVWARNKNLRSKSPEYDLLLFVANWPERRNHPWKTLLMARAMENQSYVIGVNRVGDDGNKIYHSGDSAVINYVGEVISKTKPHKENIETVLLSKEALDEWRKNFPALADADTFSVSN